MRRLLGLFSFRGRIGRLQYGLAASAIFAFEYLFTSFAAGGLGRDLSFGPVFWLFPLRALVLLPHAPSLLLAVAMAITLVADALLAALSFRRATDSEASAAVVVLAIMPVVQLAAVLGFLFPPSRPNPGQPADDGAPGAHSDIVAGAAGGLIGGGLCAGAAALSTLGFGVYGYTLFIVTPVVIGAIAGYVANRRSEISVGATIGVVLIALVMAGIALLGLAFEGAICIVMAAPLIVPMATVGGLLGRVQARAGRGSAQAAVFSLAMLPVLFACERAITAEVSFTTSEAAVIAAPPAAVWGAIVDMGPIGERPPLPFRLGLAYPVDGRIIGQGVGAYRRGVFSTGVAWERITAWRPGRELAFAVLQDPPMMRELSPYAHVDAPHLLGYFHTGTTVFTLTPLGAGRTRLTVTADHAMRIEPAFYWLPLARWAIDSNELRVLGHLRRRAEAALPAPSTLTPPAP
jgi:uncharacterized membrane protein YhaH (DUF805 family)